MQLCDLYENDCIFDKFDCCVDGKGEKMATGSYSNLFSVIPRDGQTNDVMLEASRDPLRRRLQTVKVQKKKKKIQTFLRTRTPPLMHGGQPVKLPGCMPAV